MSLILGSLVRSKAPLARVTLFETKICRNISRDNKYGAEEGHGRRNEAKRERWIKKHSVNRGFGGDWREENGMSRFSNQEGPLYDIPDWSYADGSPGVPSFAQIGKMVEQKQYAVQIKEALDLIKFSENAIKSKAEDDDVALKTFTEKKLKPKGNRSFSELL